MKTIRVIDLDVNEREALAGVVEFALREGAYLHIEVRKATDWKPLEARR